MDLTLPRECIEEATERLSQPRCRSATCPRSKQIITHPFQDESADREAAKLPTDLLLCSLSEPVPLSTVRRPNSSTRRPRTAIGCKVSAELAKARARSRLAEGKEVVEQIIAPDAASFMHNTPAQRERIDMERRVRSAARKANRINLLAIRTMTQSKAPSTPRMGRRDHFCQFSSTRSPTNTPDSPSKPFEVVLGQLNPDATTVFLGGYGLEAEEIIIFLQALAEHPSVERLDLGDCILSPVHLEILEGVLQKNDRIYEVLGGRSSSDRPLVLPQHIQAALRHNAVLHRSRIEKDTRLTEAKSHERARVVMVQLQLEVVHRENEARRKILEGQALERKQIRDAITASLQTQRAAVYRAYSRRQLRAKLNALEEAELQARPGVVALAWMGYLMVVEALETSIREDIAREEGDSRCDLRHAAYLSWTEHIHKLGKRHRNERLEREEFAAMEVEERFRVRDEEYQEWIRLVDQSEENWTEISRALLARMNKEDEERRKAALRQQEEERLKQYHAERRKKDSERLETDRMKEREAMLKSERKGRGAVRKLEEYVRGLLKEADEVLRVCTDKTSQVYRAVEERAALLAEPPQVSVIPNLRGHKATFIMGSSDWIPLLPSDLEVAIELPQRWTAKVVALEEEIIQLVKAEETCRGEAGTAVRQIVGQIDAALATSGIDYTWCLQQLDGIRSKGCPPDVAVLTSVEKVTEEKLRIWGGTVEVSLGRDEYDAGPDLKCDEVQLSDPGHITDMTQDVPFRLFAWLPDMGELHVREVAEVLTSLRYHSTAEPDPRSFKRNVNYKITLLLRRVSQPGSQQSDQLPASRPTTSELVHQETEFTTFVLCQHPYIALGKPEGAKGLEYIPEAASPAEPSLNFLLSLNGMKAFAVPERHIPVVLYHKAEPTLIPLIPFEFVLVHPPRCVYLEQMDKMQVECGEGTGSFTNGTLILSFDRGYTTDEAILVDTTGAVSVVEREVRVNGSLLGVLEDGATTMPALFPPSAVLLKPVTLAFKKEGAVGSRDKVVVATLHLSNERCTSDEVGIFLKSLRYCNPSKDPLVGVRHLSIELMDDQGRSSSMPFRVRVSHDDIPPQLVIDDTKLLFHVPCHQEVPASQLRYLEHSRLSLAPGAKVIDPDTDRFCGGFLNVKLNGAPLSEGIVVMESPSVGMGIELEATDQQYQYTVSFNSAPLGVLKYTKPDAVTEPIEILVDFVSDGTASIEAVQSLLHMLTFYTTEFQNILPGVRQVDLLLFIGPTMLKTDVDGEIIDHQTKSKGRPLSATITVKIAPPILRIPKAHAQFRYLEGSGPRRLGPLEITSDEDGCIKDWGSGYIKVEIIDGFEAGDTITIKDDYGIHTSLVADIDSDVMVGSGDRGGSLTFLSNKANELTRKALTRGTSFNVKQVSDKAEKDEDPFSCKTFAPSHSPVAPSSSRSSRAMSMATGITVLPPPVEDKPKESAKSRIRNTIREVAVHRLAQRRVILRQVLRELMERVRERRKGFDSRFQKGRASRWEITFEETPGHRVPLGVAFVNPFGALLVQFTKKAKRAGVIALSKCLTYSNESNDPKELEKKVRVTLADGTLTSSQSLIDVVVQPVDDVTEIFLQQDRIAYRQGTIGSLAVGAFSVAPLGRAYLQDPDTSSFDGGYLLVEPIAGVSKGDVLGFLTANQQEKQYELETSDTEGWHEISREILNFRPIIHLEDDEPGQKTMTLWGKKIGTVQWKSNAELRINYAPEEGAQTITLWLATYTLNCITFKNDLERVKEGVRAFRILILDPKNTTPGKATLYIDVSGPLIYLPGFSTDLTCYPNEPLYVTSKIGVCLPEKVVIQKGYFEALLGQGTEQDTLRLSLTKSSLALKDSTLLDGKTVLGRLTQSQHSVRIEFGWGSKVTKQHLLAILRGILLMSHQPTETSGSPLTPPSTTPFSEKEEKPRDDPENSVESQRLGGVSEARDLKVVVTCTDGTVEPCLCCINVKVVTLKASATPILRGVTKLQGHKRKVKKK